MQLEGLEGGGLRFGCRDVRNCVFDTDVPQVDVSVVRDVYKVTVLSFLEGVPYLEIVTVVTLNDDVLGAGFPAIKVITLVESVQVG